MNLHRDQPIAGAEDLLRELNFRHLCVIDTKTGGAPRLVSPRLTDREYDIEERDGAG